MSCNLRNPVVVLGVMLVFIQMSGCSSDPTPENGAGRNADREKSQQKSIGESESTSANAEKTKQSKQPGQNRDSRTSVFDLIPQDTKAAVIVHPARAAESELGKAILEDDTVKSFFANSRLALKDIKRVVFATGLSDDESAGDCTIVQLMKPVPKEEILQEHFGETPFEAAVISGRTVYRSSETDFKPVPPEKFEGKPAAVELANFPTDFTQDFNGHSDGTKSGTWNYYSCRQTNPTDSDAYLTRLNWSPQRKKYEGNENAASRKWPAIGYGLHPGFKSKLRALLRWESKVATNVVIRGRFRKHPQGLKGNGVQTLIYVDGVEKFNRDLRANDKVGIEFQIVAPVKVGSTVDFVVDGKGEGSNDSVLTEIVIESTSGQPDKGIAKSKPEQISKTLSNLDSAVYIAGDTVFAFGSETTMESIAKNSEANPFGERLSKIDLEHDLVALVDLDGMQKEFSASMLELAKQSRSPELAGLSVIPGHSKQVALNLDLSGKQFLELRIQALNKDSATEIEGGIDYLLSLAEGFGKAIPADNPVGALIGELVAGKQLSVNQTDVVLNLAMPNSLVEFVQNGPASSILALLEPSSFSNDSNPTNPVAKQPDPKAKDVGSEKPVYRSPPEGHPLFRDLAVGSHDCRVFFPGKPKFTEQNVKIEQGSVHVANFTGRTPRATYLFEIYTYPKAFVAKTGEDALLKQTRDNMVEMPKGRLIKSLSNRFHGSPSIDFEYEHPDTTGAGKGHVRLVLRGNRVYVLEVDGFKVPQGEIDVFLDSLAQFELKRNPSGVANSSNSDQGMGKKDTNIEKKFSRLAVPSEPERVKALALVQELYKSRFQEARSNAAKSELAKEILKEAEGIKDGSQKYVMLDVARKIAVTADDVGSALEIIQRMEESFEIQDHSMFVDSLIKLGSARILPQQRMAFIRLVMNQAERTSQLDRYARSQQLLLIAQKLSRAAREFELLKQVNARIDDAVELEKGLAAIGPQLKILETKNDDANANYGVGEYRCLLQGRFEEGLPLLAKGDDNALKAIAMLDLTSPDDFKDQIKVADQWWGIAEKSEGLRQKHSRQRAGYWYRKALPSAEGLEKKKIEVRLHEVVPDSEPSANEGSALDASRSIDLLKRIDLRKNVVQGNWKGFRGTLVSPETTAAKIVIPFDLPDEYDLTLVVERKSRNNHFGVGLMVAGVRTFVLFDYRGSTKSSLFTSPKIDYAKPVFANDKPVSLIFAVRKDSLEITVDNQRIMNWMGQTKLVPPCRIRLVRARRYGVVSGDQFKRLSNPSMSSHSEVMLFQDSDPDDQGWSCFGMARILDILFMPLGSIFFGAPSLSLTNPIELLWNISRQTQSSTYSKRSISVRFGRR